LIVVIYLGVVPRAGAHPVPDGAIFRGIQVTVRSDRIEIRYQLGLNDQTIQQELERLAPPDAEIPEDPGQAVRIYRDVMFPELPKEISVTIDGQPQRLKLRRADVMRLPHVQIELMYHVDYAATAVPAQFVLVDENFPRVPGYHLAALRARGVAVLETDAEPVLSRLARIHDPEGEAELMNLAVRRVEAVIGSTPGADPAGGGLTAGADSVPLGNGEPGAPVADLSPPEPIASSTPPKSVAAQAPTANGSDRSNAEDSRLRHPFSLWIGVFLIITAVSWMALIVVRR
jgi:hypothetical protein